jgi:hypothetical protein
MADFAYTLPEQRPLEPLATVDRYGAPATASATHFWLIAVGFACNSKVSANTHSAVNCLADCRSHKHYK